jgi:hypothetical protein
VIEWPVEDFVAAGEFVLTTGIGCDAAQLATLATEVAQAGAAALCVAVGEGAPFEAMPEGVRAVADEHGVPLVEIPWAVRFADVLRALIDRLLAEAPPLLVRGGVLLLVHSDLVDADATLAAMGAAGLEAGVAARARGPLGPLMRERAARGLLPPGTSEEHVLVLRGRRR